jgi:uncharacterized protein (TIGR02246 family)
MRQPILSAFVLLFVLGAPAAWTQQPASPSPEQNAVQETARAFVEAYDRGDAPAVAALWADDGEYIIGQRTVKGRPAIERLYADFFKAHPGSKMEIKVDSVRVLAPTVAVEQGTARVFNSPNGPPSASTYTAVHVKQNNKWRMASVRESETPLPPATEDLQQLAWLVGDWAAWGDTAKIELNYTWMANKNFLRGETAVHTSAGGGAMPGGMQVIGRDPLTGQIVSWFFNADGGHGFGVWTNDGSRWIIRTQGATGDGASTAATNILYHPDENVLSWQSVDRTVDDQRLPNTKEIVIERVSSAPQ